MLSTGFDETTTFFVIEIPLNNFSSSSKNWTHSFLFWLFVTVNKVRFSSLLIASCFKILASIIFFSKSSRFLTGSKTRWIDDIILFFWSSSCLSLSISASLGFTFLSVYRSINGAMIEVTTAIIIIREKISCEITLKDNPIVAIIIWIAPRAFNPAPKLKAVQWSLLPKYLAPM